MSTLLPVGPCQSFRDGHQTHWIMAGKSRSKGRPGTVTGFDGNYVLIEARGGESFRWWHHHPRRLRRATGGGPTRVRIFPALPAIQVAGAWFYCSTEPSPCVLGYTGGAVRVGTIDDDAFQRDELTYRDESWTPLLNPAGSTTDGPASPPAQQT